MPLPSHKIRKKVWDQTPWEPTAWAQTILGVGISWLTALAIEYFLLDRVDVWVFLRGLVLLTIGFRFDTEFWTPVLLWIVSPPVVFVVSMTMVKKARRYVLLVCTVVFTALLVVVNLSEYLE